MIHNISSFKLAGLRAGETVRAAAHDSAPVRWAMAFTQRRKRFKTAVKRLFYPHREPKTDVLRVLVHIKGGIGDVAMTRVFIKKLRETLPQAEISFCFDSKAVADMIFSDGLISRFQDRRYRPEDYDLVISGCHLLTFEYYDRARLETLAPAFLPALERGLEVQNCFKDFALYTPYLDGTLAEIAIAHGGSRVQNLGWFTGLEVGQNDRAEINLSAAKAEEILKRLGLFSLKYITIHDGINTNTDTSLGHPTRCWPREHWKEFVRLFKASFPDIKVVQLGGNKSQLFDFADISLVGKTTVADLPYILDNALLHVDGESGMVHLANLTRARCVVLFGPSKADYLAYARNVNISAPVCGGCMNISKNWMTTCLLGYPPAKQCLAAITPQTVFDAASRAVRSL
ncbi:MAG: glycosyltransferase family 9 protein [Candidatus Avelusimicrobium sp.]|uniref:glycosyltransferase family 9 protein n=1 Tax=Candidatus Avelusimicrobium sp. TaxID=3048833 RepID=UPI003EFE195F